ncbi:MAG TPA: biotin--[acetyl-CoA-carboxylase] ligase [Gemmataceae bacterium]|nr:biotin--[acetyl-CoA-carboxylase] ligase [Gemmataceae bacterium]
MNHREEWHLDTDRIGRRVLVFDCVDSTNSQAAALAADCANDGIVILAEEQTAGRGQHGRSWHCQRGLGVLLSLVLFPPPALRRPVILAAWAANAVCETILQTSALEPTIKWPNDVLIRKRKVCGILIEQGAGTVVGIGLNLNQRTESFAAANLPQAGSLAIFTGQSFAYQKVARLLIRHLDDEFRRLCQGDLNPLQSSWRNRLGLQGADVRVECHDAIHYGRLLELTWDGLTLETPSGEVVRLLPESVRHVTADGHFLSLRS